MMHETQKDIVNEAKRERQKTMDKLSLSPGTAYTYAPAGSETGSGCLRDAGAARKEMQRRIVRESN